jgi:predicted RND superfamily exporter protein
MASERAFVTSAVQGIIIATVFSFLILLFATKNIILATISILCVAIVIISVVAIMALKGWEFGVSESISVVIIIGLSVDYVVHLAADY